MIPRECVESDAAGWEVDEGRPRHGPDEDREGLRPGSTPDPADLLDDPGFPDGSDSGLTHLLTMLPEYGDPSHSSGGLSRLVTIVQPDSLESAAAMQGPCEGGEALADPVRIGKYLVVERLDGGGQAQVFRVLQFLIQNSGRLVDFDEMLVEAWGGAKVSKHTVAVTLRELKDVLGEYGSWITIRPGYGY